jgi:hypothetical protein
MCIRHISHWQPCHHQRCTGIDICSYAEAHPGLDPSDCPKGENVFREEADRGTCKICRERDCERQRRDGERRDGERRGHSRERYDSRGESVERRRHSRERHDARDESLESVSTVDSYRTERGEHGREKDRGDGRDGSKDNDDQGKNDKKKDDESGSWDSTISLALNALAHAAS